MKIRAESMRALKQAETMVSLPIVFRSCGSFLFVGIAFQLLGRWTHLYNPYPWHDLAPLCFGYLCGALRMRGIANSLHLRADHSINTELDVPRNQRAAEPLHPARERN
jgi:hypothetical protein